MAVSTSITRRELVGAAGAATAAAGLGLTATAIADEAQGHVCANLPESWDIEADVVVIGMGAAGLSAAVAAKLEGAEDVLVLEVAPEEESGGTTRVSGCMLMIPDDVEGAITYQTALNGPYTCEPEFMRAWAEGVVANYDWLTKDLEFELGDATAGRPEFPGLPGGEHIKTYYVDGVCGESSLWYPLLDKAEELGVEFLYETRATELVRNYETKEVYGVIAGSKAIKARKGVVMACGGFANNPNMIQQYYCSTGAPKVFPLGSPYNVGDGVVMVQEIGAQLWHMNNYACGTAQPRGVAADSNLATWAYLASHDYIYVNGEGDRFMYEETKGIARHGKQKTKGVWPLSLIPTPTWMVMGSACGSVDMMGGIDYMSWAAMITGTGAMTNEELIEAGILFKADTVEELAQKIGYDPATLAATVQKYNDAIDAGEPDEFGRGSVVHASNLFDARAKSDAIAGDSEGGEYVAIEEFPLEKLEPPFYAMELALSMLNTQGGAKRNGLSQVLDLHDNPIPRLYSAGEFGSIYGYMYNGGGNCSEAVSTGRVAGQQAAKLESWE